MNTNTTALSPAASRPWLMALFAALIYAVLFLLTSCGTTAGFGSDVQKVGEEIEDAAR